VARGRLEAFSDGVITIIWVNHHHLIHAVHRVDGALLWWNNLVLHAGAPARIGAVIRSAAPDASTS